MVATLPIMQLCHRVTSLQAIRLHVASSGAKKVITLLFIHIFSTPKDLYTHFNMYY